MNRKGCGRIVNHFSNSQLTNIVPGRYVFKLTVTDGQGLSGSDTVSVIVHPDPLVMSLVELTLTMEATVLTQSELDSLQQKLVLLIGDNTARLHVRDMKIEHKTGQVVIIFYVEKNVSILRHCRSKKIEIVRLTFMLLISG